MFVLASMWSGVSSYRADMMGNEVWGRSPISATWCASVQSEGGRKEEKNKEAREMLTGLMSETRLRRSCLRLNEA